MPARPKKQMEKRASKAIDRMSNGDIEKAAENTLPALKKGAEAPPVLKARKTKQRAGRAVAVYVEDALGRRLVVAAPHVYAPGELFLADTVVIALTQQEAKEAIAVLRQLAEELPPE
jgi:hypothetical protein